MRIERKRYVVMRRNRTEVWCGLSKNFSFRPISEVKDVSVKTYHSEAQAESGCSSWDRDFEVVPVIETILTEDELPTLPQPSSEPREGRAAGLQGHPQGRQGRRLRGQVHTLGPDGAEPRHPRAGRPAGRPPCRRGHVLRRRRLRQRRRLPHPLGGLARHEDALRAQVRHPRGA